jgi:hypothetical protein
MRIARMSPTTDQGSTYYMTAITAPLYRLREIIALTAVLMGIALLVSVAQAAAPTLPAEKAVIESRPDVTATSTPTCVSGWSVIDSPNPFSRDNQFYGVAASSSTDVWAVGVATNAFIEHWDGTNWSVITGPATVSETILYDVAVVSSSDVWAVGQTYAGYPGYYHSLAIHWDGTAWSRVPSPNLSEYGINSLFGVDAVSSTDVWAVGYAGHTSWQTLAMHWDGNAWSIVPSPNTPSPFNRLFRVAATAANDVWAVGSTSRTDDGQTIIMRWDGSQWKMEATTFPGALYGVAAVSANDVWAVGYSGGSLLIHWDGASWTAWPSVNYVKLLGIDAIASDDIWAVGHADVPQTGGAAAMIHWNGADWMIVTGATPEPPGSTLVEVVAISANEAWAVGDQYIGQPFAKTMTMKYAESCDTTPTAQPSPSATPTTPSTATQTGVPSTTPEATSTPIPATTTATSTIPPAITAIPSDTPAATPTSTARPLTQTPIPASPTVAGATATPTPTSTVTICSVQFADVAPTNAMYTYIRCLACKNLLSGYSDGTFRPNNDVTRGQLSKLVANSAGFSEPAGGQSFEDVPANNTFYLFVERMASRGITGGYPCGGTGEPCGQGNRPYFRPNANATRGQISKIVSEARGLSGTLPGQTFADVPVGNAFHPWIERLAARGVIGGYECGGPGEPCGAGNLPYFRPNNNATRGQVSKIASNTFFPNCHMP